MKSTYRKWPHWVIEAEQDEGRSSQAATGPPLINALWGYFWKESSYPRPQLFICVAKWSFVSFLPEEVLKTECLARPVIVRHPCLCFYDACAESHIFSSQTRSPEVGWGGGYSHWNNQLSNTWQPLFTKDKWVLFFFFHLNLQTCIRPPGIPGGSDSKESACRRPGFDSWVRKIPWRREWLPAPVFLPGEFRGQKSLVGYRGGSMGSQRVGHDLACMEVSFIFSSVRERLIEFRFMTNKKHKTKQKTENEIRDNSK